MRKILAIICAGSLLCGCAHTPSTGKTAPAAATGPQFNLSNAEIIMAILSDQVATVVIIAGDIKGVNLRPAFLEGSVALTFLSQSTNQISIADLQAVLTTIKAKAPVPIPVIADQLDNFNQLLGNLAPQFQNMQTNQVSQIIQGLAAAQASGFKRALVVTAKP